MWRSMRYKFAICDDDAAVVSYLEGIVRSWAEGRQLEVVVHTFPSAESFLFQYAEEKDYDVLLLDIEMKQMDGVALAKQLRRDNDTIQIIFITGYSDYIAEGYEVAALHYLMKPVKEEKLAEVLERAVGRVKRNEKQLFVEAAGEMVRIPLCELRYLEVNLNYVTLHARQTLTVKKPLKEFEKELDERFFRLGRSYIVNLGFVQRVTRKEVFLAENAGGSAGVALPLPRGMYDRLNRAIIEKV